MSPKTLPLSWILLFSYRFQRSLQQERFNYGVKDPDFDGDLRVRLRPNVLHLEEGSSHSANSHFYIGICPTVFDKNAT